MKATTKISLAVILALVVVLVLFTYLYLDYPLPPYEGELALDGLGKPVEVYSDDYGVPHIYAQNEHDLFFAAGYIVARERLFQMTISAAVVEGRLAELFGKESLADDIYLRTWGIPKMGKILAANLHPEAKTIIGDFCDGINAYIDEVGDNLPVEFKLLRIQPIRWEPKHVTGFARLMAYTLTQSWNPEIVLGQVAYIFGESRMRELWPAYPGEQPPASPQITMELDQLWAVLAERDQSLREMLNMNGSEIGSNNWVISGTRTVTGKPILANDPHLGLSQPAQWYEMHLVGGRFDVSGVCFPGIPVVVLGQNEACAWGATNLMVDDLDFYVETVNPEHPNQYLYDGQWHDMDIREETVTIRGGDEKTVVIRETVHGPVISDIHKLLRNGPQVVSMRWTGHDISDELQAFVRLNIMENWEDFTEAAKSFGAPGQNFIYADTAGNIGWRPFARIPMRRGGENLVPLPGESSDWDWQGYVPFEEMPFKFNPPEGLIVTANNKTIDNSFRYYVSHLWHDPSRAKRILELLGNRPRISVEDVAITQTDVLSPYAREIAPYFVEAFEGESVQMESHLGKALQFLREWDGDHSPESAAAAVFNAALVRLLHNIYADEMKLMGDGFYEGWLGPKGSGVNTGIPLNNLRHILRKGHAWWFDDHGTKDVVETRDDMLRKSFQEGVQEVVRLLGPSPDNWQWGRMHTATHLHTIGKNSRLLDFLFGFNVGPFASGGANTTVNNGEYRFAAPFQQVVGPSFRRIVDLSDLDGTQMVIPTGQSGLPKSPHYADQTPLYNAGKYRTVHSDDMTVKNSGFRRLMLLPRD